MKAMAVDTRSSARADAPSAGAAGAAADPATGAATRHLVRMRYMPGLDGLRAFAVTGVLLYHADLNWIPGGFLGVDVFFVISGYLITSLLLAEFARDAGISLRSFWIRRARRLLPAAWALLAGVFVLVLFHPAEIARFFRELPSALSYVYNWFLVLSEQSYFASMAP
jgi:peptidoglycan/LPS O-acetylase OafA/YrhL